MPIFNDFDENGKLVEKRIEALSQDNFERYLAQYGSERTEGYKDAMEDMLKLFGPTIWTNFNHDNPALKNHSTLRRKISTFAEVFCQQQSFFRYLKRKTKKQPDPKPSL